MRKLEREIGSVCRKVARQVAEGAPAQGRASPARRSRELLGPPAVPVRRQAAHGAQPGVATGLAWTPVGGDVLFVEATAMPGQGQAHDHRPARRRDERVGAGGAVVRARARRRAAPDLPEDWFATHDLHVHVPAGAIPKDGPSAGHHHGHGARLAGHRAPGARGHGDDRRDHADRPGAADRRAEGEGAGRPARGDHAHHRARPQRARPRRLPRGLRDDLEFVWVRDVERCWTRRFT